MGIAINGRQVRMKAPKDVLSLLSKLGIGREAALVRVNGELAPDSAKLSPDDDIDVLRMRSKGEEPKKRARRNGYKKTGVGSERKDSRLNACFRCKKPAAVTLSYAGYSLCRQHFVAFFESRALRTVREFHMLKRGETVAVGLSGGKDSGVCLHLLHKISKSLPIKLIAITIDSGIGKYSATTLALAKRECRKLGVEHRIFSFKKLYGKSLDALLSEKGGKQACSFCGVMRRHALNRAAREAGASKLVIGHNADDVAQTVMMNFMRNEPERLARFGPVTGVVENGLFVKRIKPLFLAPERDVAAYALIKGIPIHHEQCPYAENAFRQHVRRMLNETDEKYPATKLRVVRAFLSQQKLLQEGAKMRLKEKGGKVGKCPSCGEPASGKGAVCSLCTMLG